MPRVGEPPRRCQLGKGKGWRGCCGHATRFRPWDPGLQEPLRPQPLALGTRCSPHLSPATTRGGERVAASRDGQAGGGLAAAAPSSRRWGPQGQLAARGRGGARAWGQVWSLGGSGV